MTTPSTSKLPTLGFVGTGTISAAMISGLCSLPHVGPIVISPRNEKVAADLAAKFKNVTIAASNQAVLDACDLAVLAVRPQIAVEVLSQLKFRANHDILTVIATFSLERIRTLTSPARSIVRAVPLPAVSRHQGATAVYPQDSTVSGLFNRLGTAIVLDNEAEFDAYAVITATMASYFGFAETVTAWMTRRGVANEKAFAFVGEMFRGLSGATASASHHSFAKLAEEHQTPGGLNEQVIRQLTHAGVFQELDRALDAILKRTQDAART